MVLLYTEYSRYSEYSTHKVSKKVKFEERTSMPATGRMESYGRKSQCQLLRNFTELSQGARRQA